MDDRGHHETLPPDARRRSLRRVLIWSLLAILVGGSGWANLGTLNRWRYRWSSTDHLVEAARAQPANRDLILIAGERLLGEQKPATALGLLAPLAAQHPSDAKLNLLAGRAALEVGDRQIAADRLEAACRADPSDADAYYWSAEFIYQGGDAKAAEKLLLHTTEVDPHYAPAWLLLGRLSVEAHQMPTALTRLGRAIQLQPTAAAYHYQATALKELGELSQAEQAARQAVRLDGNAAGYALLGEILASSSDGDQLREAQTYLRQSLQLRPDDLGTLLVLARTHRVLGEYGEAIKVLRRLIRHGPLAPQNYWVLAQAYRAAGRPDLARQTQRIYDQLGPRRLQVGAALQRAEVAGGALPAQLALIRAYLRAGRGDLARKTVAELQARGEESAELDRLAKTARNAPIVQPDPLPPDPEGDSP